MRFSLLILYVPSVVSVNVGTLKPHNSFKAETRSTSVDM
jgi:hypothetical protein